LWFNFQPKEDRQQMHRVTIRQVVEEDAQEIVDLLNPIIQAGIYTTMDEPLSVAEQVEFIRGFPLRGVFHAAVCDESGAILGIQDLVPLAAESRVFAHVGVISTFVSLSAHGQGIGHSLSQATFQAAQALGFTKISATIRADNPRAVAFYLGQGFRIIGAAHKHALVHGRYIDEILAERFLD
jgi:L-amino acid N-acyltransferase YncA